MLRLALALVLFGCGGGTPAPAAAPVTTVAPSDGNVTLNKLADASCACKDASCARGAVDTFIAWINAHKDAMGEEREAEGASKRLFDCALAAHLSQSELAD